MSDAEDNQPIVSRRRQSPGTAHRLVTTDRFAVDGPPLLARPLYRQYLNSAAMTRVGYGYAIT
jgi:hypothetical protein